MLDVSSTPLPKLAPRAPDSHKGDFGRALLIGGSRGMSGAIALAGMAALRGGAGLVTLAVPETCLDVVAGHEPSYMTIPLACDAEGRLTSAAAKKVDDSAAKATAVAIGPGLGQSPALVELVTGWYTSLAVPVVMDADALNALAQRRDVLSRPGGPRILTPHPGEFARLVDQRLSSREAQESLAHRYAMDWRAVIVLKGHHTLVTDGQKFAHNPTGNPGMATGGCGDVLTGVITALLCQGLSPFEAARLGAYIHGVSGDLAAAELGQVSMIASDLIRFLPAAFLSQGNQ
jgi:ADP-dependent NAD(P)H-hydrate dehydratase